MVVKTPEGVELAPRLASSSLCVSHSISTCALVLFLDSLCGLINDDTMFSLSKAGAFLQVE